jgi:hypothetical protein
MRSSGKEGAGAGTPECVIVECPLRCAVALRRRLFRFPYRPLAEAGFIDRESKVHLLDLIVLDSADHMGMELANASEAAEEVSKALGARVIVTLPV